MEKEFNTTQMEISTVVTSLMVSLKGLGHTIGKIALIIEEILSKVSEMVMEFGLIPKGSKAIKDIICLIESMAMEYMIGEMAMYTKEISSRTREVERGSCFIMKEWSITVFG